MIFKKIKQYSLYILSLIAVVFGALWAIMRGRIKDLEISQFKKAFKKFNKYKDKKDAVNDDVQKVPDSKLARELNKLYNSESKPK